MIRVLIADDHAVVREGLKRIVAGNADMEVTAEAASGQEALELARATDCDLVLLDLAMPGKDGLDTLKELKALRPHLPVLVLSVYPEEQYAVRLLRAGAAGYLTKESAPEELVAAIRKVSRGGRYVSETLAEQLAVLVGSASDRPLHEGLSDREFRVMLMLASGKIASQVADELCLSVKTISTYRSRALRKMNMRNNAEFSFYAVKHGLLG
ncbi:MAG: response regulator transcription factor [Vicinamibacteria bacterium]